MTRALKTTLLSAVATLALAAPAAACDNANIAPTATNLAKVQKATLCLMNKERTKRGLGKLHSSARLRRAALKHSRAMVQRRFFDHTSPGGSTMVSRISKAGYAGWGSLGEN